MPSIDELTEIDLRVNRAGRSKPGRYEIEQDQIYTSIGNIVLAGMAFPGILGSVLLVWNFATREISVGELPFALMMCVTLSLVGAIVGAVITGIFGLLSTILLSIFHFTTRCRIHPKTLVHLAGGMTGFWSIAFLFGGQFTRGQEVGIRIVLIAIFAMAVCQVATTIGYAKRNGNYQRLGTQNELQFGIFDMFVGVTWVAAIVAFLGIFPKGMMLIAGVWSTVQVLFLIVSYLIHLYLTRSERQGEPAA